MKVFFAADHAGFELKNKLVEYVRDELGFNVEDCGAYELDPGDDYPSFVKKAAQAVAKAPNEHRAVILGGSGQGEAIAANRIQGVRAVVYYGRPSAEQIDSDSNTLDIVASTRSHNDANVLSLGARFINVDEAKGVVERWLSTNFSGAERHIRRIEMLDQP